MDLVPVTGYTRGALLLDTTVVYPDTAASGFIDLVPWPLPPGAGPVLIEVTGVVQLEAGVVPIIELLDPGAVMYYRPNGDLYVRSMEFHFRKRTSSGFGSFMPPPVSIGPDSIVMVDDSTGVHGLRMAWSAGSEQNTGMNVHNPPSGDCFGLLISFLCYPAPEFDPSRISNTPPTGTIRIRVYGAETYIVRCSPNLVERGSQVSCKALKSDTGLIATHWIFSGPPMPPTGDSVLVEASVSDSVWVGTAVLSGTVRAIIPTPTGSDTLVGALEVRNRSGSAWRWDDGSKWSFGEAAVLLCSFSDYVVDFVVARATLLGVNRRASTCDRRLQASIEPWVVAAPDSGFRADSVRGGPNRGLWYVTEGRYRMDRVWEMNPFIRPDGRADTLPDFADQLLCWQNIPQPIGSPVVVNFYRYNTSCQKFDLGAFFAGIAAHEGFGTQDLFDSLRANGHEARRRIAARDSTNDPYRIIEPLVRRTYEDLRFDIGFKVDSADRRIGAMADAGHLFVRDNYVEPGLLQDRCGRVWVFETNLGRYVQIRVRNQREDSSYVCM